MSLKTKIIDFRDVEPVPEPGKPGVTIRVVIGKKDGAPNFIMRVLEVEENSSIPIHTHVWEHEIFIHAGKGVLLLEGEEKPVVKDNAVFVPPNLPHGFANRGKGPLRLICLIPRID